MNPSLRIDLTDTNNKDLKKGYQSTIQQRRQGFFLKIKQFEDQRSNSFLLDIIPRLRGGGCGAAKIPQDKVTKLNNKLPINFASNINDHTNVISEKSYTFSDKLNQDDILSSFQWFYNHKEYFQILCNDDQINSIFYHLIESCAEKLLKQLIVYIKLSGFLFYQLLDICNDLFRVIFSYQLKNDDRYMQENLKQTLLEIISEIESQINVEAINIWKNGVEFELQLIKTCIAHCRTNSEKEKELAIAILCGVASSISQLSPSSELIDALIEAGKYLLLSFYDKQIQHPLQKYEIYYFFENLKWSVINQLKLGYSVQKTINTVLDGYNLYIKPSKDWMIHFCWVKFISDLMSYRPVVNKITLSQAQNSNQLNWNQLIVSNQIVQLPYDKASGKLQIFGKKGNLNLKQFHQLILFQEYLLDIQDKFQLLPTYAQFQFNTPHQELIGYKDLNIKKLTSESNLEILTLLNENLKFLKEQLISLFESMSQQISSNLSKTQSILNSKLSKDDIQYSIKQIKLYSQSFVYNLYELNIMINQERQAIEIIQNTIMQNKQFFKEKSLVYQTSILQIIKQLEQEYEQEYLTNQKKFPFFLIQIFHQLSIYQDEVSQTDLQPETSNIRIQTCQFDYQQLQTALTNFTKYVDKYIIQQKSMKRKFLKIYESKEVHLFLEERISQTNQSQILLNVYNFNFIQQLGADFIEYYNKCFIQQIEISQVDLRQNRIACNFIILISKLVNQLLTLQQRKVISLNASKDIQTSKETSQQQDFMKNQENIKTFLEKLILDRRTILQKVLDKYPEKIQNDHHFTEFNEVSELLEEGIDVIKKQNWSNAFKNKHILIFKEIKNKLQILELLKNNQKLFLIKIISLGFGFGPGLPNTVPRTQYYGWGHVKKVINDVSPICIPCLGFEYWGVQSLLWPKYESYNIYSRVSSIKGQTT